ncbi:uncharacterized protein LOC113213054 [Frankliniella occidentalis]|uniref:Uncharacterized protein LOC113213054 n=1 Tax=Frankliniella occidentalis TaxID=133901 RepID=A0A9C6X815_FRAOC|nr:uncharacterized protein LOC113213054 [Frankliniella occidentalis]
MALQFCPDDVPGEPVVIEATAEDEEDVDGDLEAIVPVIPASEDGEGVPRNPENSRKRTANLDHDITFEEPSSIEEATAEEMGNVDGNLQAIAPAHSTAAPTATKRPCFTSSFTANPTPEPSTSTGIDCQPSTSTAAAADLVEIDFDQNLYEGVEMGPYDIYSSPATGDYDEPSSSSAGEQEQQELGPLTKEQTMKLGKSRRQKERKRRLKDEGKLIKKGKAKKIAADKLKMKEKRRLKRAQQKT